MLAIVDYNAGNLRSVELAVARTGTASVVTRDADQVARADRVIFPGVGAARSAMGQLLSLGLDEAIREAVTRGKPVLGICLGTQIILEESDEDGPIPCLGILRGRVRRFPEALDASPQARKVPHMGWNEVTFVRRHPVFAGLEDGEEFYFVHAYYPVVAEESDVIATTEYGVTFSCVIGRDNLVAVQFHPERSGRLGLRVIENFLRWNGDYRA